MNYQEKLEELNALHAAALKRWEQAMDASVAVYGKYGATYGQADRVQRCYAEVRRLEQELQGLDYEQGERVAALDPLFD